MELDIIYKKAAHKAFEDGVSMNNGDSELINWIQSNCAYQDDALMFLVLGIGSHLADLISQNKGFENQIDEIWKTKIAPNWECNQLGEWARR